MYLPVDCYIQALLNDSRIRLGSVMAVKVKQI